MKRPENLQSETVTTVTNLSAAKLAQIMIENSEVRTQKKAAKLLAEGCDLAPSTIEKKITAGKKELAMIDETDNLIDLDMALENRLINDDQDQDKEVTESDDTDCTEFHEKHVKLATQKTKDDYLSAIMFAQGIHKVCREILDDILDIRYAIGRPSKLENDHFDILYRVLGEVIDKMSNITIDANVDKAVKEVIYASLNHTDEE